ncbi:MAG TPA: hypothetical protein VJM09_01250 [Sphingobium sp.]|nr:hypothetical protein [Sphingobium sp.]
MTFQDKNRGLIVAFDSWTGGITNLDRIKPYLDSIGYTLKLYHTESWQPADAQVALPSATGLEMTDVGDRRGSALLELFLEPRPAAVVFLSIDTFSHRAVNRFCKHAGIPTLWLNHGLGAILTTNKGKSLGMHPIARIKYLLPRVTRLFLQVLPTYMAALRVTKASPSDWFRIAKDTYLLAVGRYITKNASDSRCNITAIYTEADREQVIEKYWHEQDEVVAVGNPDLIYFGLKDEEVGLLAKRGAPETNEVVYVDSRLVHYGMAYASEEEFIAHLDEVRASVERQGYSLVLKLHPGHDGTAVPDILARKGYTLLQKEEFCARLLRAAAVIVEPSTAAAVPTLMGLPLLLGKFGSLRAMEYGLLLLNYPRSTQLSSLDDLGFEIHRLWNEPDKGAVRQWIGRNSGPLPSREFPKRVGNLLERVIEEARETPCVRQAAQGRG